MAKYNYKITPAYFNKQDTVYIQRKGGKYYISEGHAIFAFDEFTYTMEFINHFPLRFPELEEGKRILNRKKEGIVGEGMDLWSIYNEAALKAEYPAVRTGLRMEMQVGDYAHVYKAKEPVFIRNTFDDMITEVFDCHTTIGGDVTINAKMKGMKKIDPILFESEKIKALILPINATNETLLTEIMKIYR